MTNILKTERLKTDILIIGGGTAGCYAAVTVAEHSDAKVNTKKLFQKFYSAYYSVHCADKNGRKIQVQ